MAEGPNFRPKPTPTLKELSNAVDSVVNWFSLGVKLELDRHVLIQIEKDHRGDNERCKYEMLDRWLRNAKQPTWKAMADALCLIGEHQVALNIQTKYCSSSTATGAAIPPATSPCRQSAVAVTQRNIQKIQGKFGTLVTKSSVRLHSRGITVENLQTFLITVYSSRNTKDASGMVTTVLEAATTLQQIFRVLSKYGLWDYLNYYLLQSIIEEFASDDNELNEMMKQYQVDLTGHILTLKIPEYLDAIHSTHPSIATSEDEDSHDELLEKLSVKVGANITDHSLSYVYAVWQSLASQFSLPQPALLLRRIATGCIGVTWLLPVNLVDHVTKTAQETSNMFTEQHILRVMLGDHCIYPMETKPTLLESETAALKRKRDPSEGNEGVIQASERVSEEMQERAKAGDPQSRGDRDAGNLSVMQTFQQLSDDESEDPEEIPEHKQAMKCVRVIRTNYSLLYSHLDAGRFLSKLPDKELISEMQLKSAKSYHQRFAQNAILINALLTTDRPCNRLLKFCDTLETTPGQEHIGKKLLQDYKHSVKLPSAVSVHRPPPSVATAVHSDFSSTSESFQQLQLQVMDLLDHFPNALAKLKQVLASLVLPLGERKTAPLVDPLSYEGTHTVRELFRFMSRYWNPLSTDLLSLLLEGLGYNQAAAKVTEFVEVRGGKGRDVLCIRQLPTLASGQNDLDVPDLQTIHNSPLSSLQSLHPAVFAQLPQHKVSHSRKTIRISVQIDKSLLCVVDYEDITTALSGFFEVPKAGLLYCGCSKAPLVLCWEASHKLSNYFTSVIMGVSGHRLLAENRVSWIAISDLVYKVPTLKEVELLEACLYGLVRKVPYLLRTGANVNVTTFNGGTALERASFSGHQKVVELLLGAEANPDLQDKDGYSPLHSASQEGYIGIVDVLIKAGAKVDLQTKDGSTPLYIASQNGHLPVVEHLIGAKADVNHQREDGSTPLYIASEKGHLPVVERLIGAKADVNHHKDGWTPLFIACQHGHLPVVEHLVGAKADVNYQKKDGVTALMVASGHGHPSVLRTLLKAGATVNTTGQVGKTALYFAVDRGHEDVVELLLEANADSDLPKKDSQETALMVAARKGSVEIIRKLVHHGANVNLTNKAGLTAYDIASTEGHPDVCQELLTQRPL